MSLTTVIITNSNEGYLKLKRPEAGRPSAWAFFRCVSLGVKSNFRITVPIFRFDALIFCISNMALKKQNRQN